MSDRSGSHLGPRASSADATLIVEAEPGTHVRVIPRSRGDEIPDDAFSGSVPQSGRLSVTLRRAYYVVVSADHETEEAHLESGESTQTVRLRRARQH